MKRIVTAEVVELPPVAPELLEEAASAGTDLAEHDRLASRVAALDCLEHQAPPPGPPLSWPLRIVAWNLERVLHPALSADLLAASGAELVVLSEVDCGMARTANRHNAADLAARLGMGYLYGVEFVELTLGINGTMRLPPGARNSRALHGNAILSRFPLHEPRLIRLDEGGFWFGGRRGQKRLGGRMALAARLGAGAESPVVVSVHLESDSDTVDRAAQMRTLLAALEIYAPGAPMVIGGDLNTKALPANPPPGQEEWFLHPEADEKLFAVMHAAGFDHLAANEARCTQRIGITGKVVDFRRLDWFFTRGLDISAPQTLAALGPEDTVLSDHEPITITADRRAGWGAG